MEFRENNSSYVLLHHAGPSITQSYLYNQISAFSTSNQIGFMVEPYHINFCKSVVSADSIPLIGMVNYPLGLSSTDYSVRAAKWCLQQGAEHILTALPLGRFRSGYVDEVQSFLSELSKINPHAFLRIALDAECLSVEEKKTICDLLNQTKQINAVHIASSSQDERTLALHFFKDNLAASIQVGFDGLNHIEQVNEILSQGANFVSVMDAELILVKDIVLEIERL